METDNNQRQYRRAPLSGSVKFFDWNRPVQAEALEISAGGMFLRTAAVLPEGAMTTVRLILPGLGKGITVLGKVVRTVKGGLFRPAGMGIRFVDIAASHRRSILDYVALRGMATT